MTRNELKAAYRTTLESLIELVSGHAFLAVNGG